MSYNIETTPHLEKELKDLAKRYKSMKQDFGKFKDSLKEDPFQGVDLGGGLRKIRMAIDSKRKGKAGEAPPEVPAMLFKRSLGDHVMGNR